MYTVITYCSLSLFLSLILYVELSQSPFSACVCVCVRVYRKHCMTIKSECIYVWNTFPNMLCVKFIYTVVIVQ